MLLELLIGFIIGVIVGASEIVDIKFKRFKKWQ